MSILVIEGPDGTGKTTLAKLLEARRGFRYVHNGPPPKGTSLFRHYAAQIAGAEGQNVVFDRLHVGELIYGPVMRGKSLITIEELRLLNRLLFGLGGKVVFCDTADTTIEKSWLSRRGQEYIDDGDKLYQVIFKYRELFDQEFTADNTVAFDYQQTYLTEALNRGIWPDGFNSPLCPLGVIGGPRNRFLFIGERVNSAPDYPFFTMSDSSGYLNHCLWDAGYKEWEMAFTNAISHTGVPRDLYSMWSPRREQVVITLGKVAHQACVNQAVPHLEAPHPQYVKRFRGGKGRHKYAELLNRFRGEL